MLHFAYQDEADYASGDGEVFCVTALVFPSSCLRDLGAAMLSDFGDVLRPDAGTFSFGVFLHGTEMLPDQPDDRKLKA